jgi:hypothetical protein
MDTKSILQEITFGRRVAEEEFDTLTSYFVETEHWRRVYSRETDIVRGPKGSGKSAIYFLLLSKPTSFSTKAYSWFLRRIRAEPQHSETWLQTLQLPKTSSEPSGSCISSPWWGVSFANTEYRMILPRR